MTNTNFLLELYRMTFRLSIFFLLLSYSISLHAQSGVLWSNNYGGSSNDIPSSVQSTLDNGYIIAGQSASSDSMVGANYGKYDAWIVKLNSFGEIIWEKNYGGSADDYALDIQATSDNGYIMIGGSFSNDIDLPNNEGNSDIWIVKLNANSTIQWSKTFGGKGVDFGTSIQQTSDGGYILSACTSSGGDAGLPAGAGGNDILVIKLDEDGNMEWQKLYGGSRHDGPKKILQTSDGGYLVGANTWSTDGDISQNNGHSDALFIKLDEAGLIEWSKNFGGVTTDRMNDFIEHPSGDFVLTGTYSSLDLTGNGFGGRYDENFWILKFSSSGNQIWEKNYGGSKYDEAKSITLTSDGGYLIGGVANSNDGNVPGNEGLKDLWVIKTNSQGNLDWSQAFGGEYNEEIIAVSEVDADQYLLVGYSSSVYADTLFESNGLEDWWVIKMGDANTAIAVNLGEDLTLCSNEEFYFDVSIPNCICQYEWNDGSFDSQRTLSTYTTTTYSVTITDPNGFSVSDEIVINITGPELTVSTSEASCYGLNDGSINLIPLDNYSYLWENGETVEDRENLTAGTYLVTVTDDMGCSQVQVIDLPEPSPIHLNEVITHISCYGESDGMINLNPAGGTGNFDYNWTGVSSPNNQDISELPVGNYSVTVIDDNNCTTASSWNITQPDQISIGLIPSLTSCFDSEDGQIQINVNGGTGMLDYKWNNGATTANLTGVAAGTYTVTVSDINQCEATESVTIVSPIPIEVDAIVALASCSGNNDGSILTTTSGGIGNYQYFWNTGATSPDLENLMAGTYTVTVSDDNLCEQITEFVVSQNSNIEVSSNISHVSCYNGNDGAIIINPSGGSGTYSFLWDTGDTDQNINQLSSGDYIVTISDQSNCQQIQLFTIENPEEILIFPTIMPVSCYGGMDGSYEVDVTGGTGGYLLDWGVSGNTNLSADTYTITITDENSCLQISDITIPQPDSLYANLQVVHPTLGGDGMITASEIGGTPPYNFEWNDGEFTGDQLTNLSGGIYALTLTDGNDCVYEVTILLESVSTKEIESLQSFEVYPNPSDGQFYIQLEFDQSEEVNIEITNELGQTIKQFSTTGNSILENINLPHISAGMYFISIKTEKGIAVKRMVVL